MFICYRISIYKFLSKQEDKDWGIEMAIFKQGEVVRLKSDHLVEGAVIGIVEAGREIH